MFVCWSGIVVGDTACVGLNLLGFGCGCLCCLFVVYCWFVCAFCVFCWFV